MYLRKKIETVEANCISIDWTNTFLNEGSAFNELRKTKLLSSTKLFQHKKLLLPKSRYFYLGTWVIFSRKLKLKIFKNENNQING